VFAAGVDGVTAGEVSKSRMPFVNDDDLIKSGRLLLTGDRRRLTSETIYSIFDN